MAAVNTDVIADWGTTCTIKRGKRDGTTKQITSYSTLASSVPIYLQPAGANVVLSQDAPTGDLYVGFLNRRDVPTLLQDGDLLTTAAGDDYVLHGINDFTSHTEVLCSHADVTQNGT